MMKMGQILKKKVKIDENEKHNIFLDFSENMERCRKKVINDENG